MPFATRLNWNDLQPNWEAISRADVERKIAEKQSEKQCRPNHWDVDLSACGPVRAQNRSRLEIAAANLAAAASAVPQVTTSPRANRAKLESARRDLNLRLAETGSKITAVAFQISALARVLRKFPKFNSSLSADGKTLWRKRYVSVGVAVDTPYGLVVPVIRHADKKGLKALAQELRDLADRARCRKLCNPNSAAPQCPSQIFGGNRGPASRRSSTCLEPRCRASRECLSSRSVKGRNSIPNLSFRLISPATTES